MTPYCSLAPAELDSQQESILDRHFATHEELDSAFFGDSGFRRGNREERIERFCESYAEERNGQRFQKRVLRKKLTETFGTGISVFMILYYIALALYYWRKLRG